MEIPGGLVTAEVFNWTGNVLRFPRSAAYRAFSREEVSRSGVYLLTGEGEDGPLAYIGEAEAVRDRLKHHIREKDWWTECFVVTTAGDALNKAHIRYLEARLIETARNVGRVELENQTNPPRPRLSEAQMANMEGFLETLLLVMPALRVDLLLSQTEQIRDQSNALSQIALPEFVLTTPKYGIAAYAVIQDGKFIVRKGSKAQATWIANAKQVDNYAKIHAQLLTAGVLVAEGKLASFAEDTAFSSPSAAAAVINGRSTNGTTAWTEPVTGRTYKEWEASRLSETECEAG